MMNTPKKILIIRTKSMGDVLLTLPAVHAVRESYPDAHISFLVDSVNAALLQGFEDVDEVIANDRSKLKNPWTAFPEFFKLLYHLRPGRFSLGIDLQGYGETAWLLRFSGAKERWGSVYSWGRKWAYTCGVARRGDLHPADWNLFLLQQCGLKIGEIENQFKLPPAALEAAQNLFTKHGLDSSQPTLFIHAFTSRAPKNWPLDNYLAVAEYWRSKGVQVVFGGGPGDRAPLEPARALGFSVFAGAPLLVSAGLMKLSTIVLGGDTGMLHLAIALGKPARMLIRNVSSGTCDLYQHREWVIPAPVKNEIASLTVDAVIAESGIALETETSETASFRIVSSQ